ncbi:MAG: type III polyketide synthase [Acidocella sp.]|nr:type III polyketide synthase [Acidocella sp.]
MVIAHINRISTAHPPHDVHQAYQNFIAQALAPGKARTVFTRMASRAGIAHRYSVLHQDGLVEADAPRTGFYRRGAYPGTAARMGAYAEHAPALAERAVAGLDLGDETARITHLIVASCTGFVAPGLDQLLAKRLGLRPDLLRTVIGFMGCAAAVPALRVAQATILADPCARVLVINLELCTLHMQETDDVEIALSFLLFGDGATAALVTAHPHGLALGNFRTTLIPQTEDHITWVIGDQGFIMHLSGKVPGVISRTLRADPGAVLGAEGTQAIDLWAVHGGGRTVLDAVQSGLALPDTALTRSRAILAAHGNMSSATIMFVLAGMMPPTSTPGQRGFAMAFGPGMVAETFHFTAV